MMKAPNTPEEWRQYVANISAGELTSKARAANSMKFVEMLQQGGMTIPQVKRIVMLFVARFIKEGLAPPPGGVYDMIDMLDDPKVLKISLPDADPFFEEPPDDVDKFTSK